MHAALLACLFTEKQLLANLYNAILELVFVVVKSLIRENRLQCPIV